jgi:hypothetical protein
MPKEQSQHACGLFVDWVEVGSLNELMQQEASLHILQIITHLQRAKNSSCCMLSNLTADIFLMQMCETPRCVIPRIHKKTTNIDRVGANGCHEPLSDAFPLALEATSAEP